MTGREPTLAELRQLHERLLASVATADGPDAVLAEIEALTATPTGRARLEAGTAILVRLSRKYEAMQDSQ